jgi:hypothetical protein
LDLRSIAIFNNIEIIPVSALSTLCKKLGLNHQVVLKFETIYTIDCNSEKNLFLNNEDVSGSDEDNDKISKSINCNKCNKCIHCAFLVVRK